jgi:hypothetical protein
MKINKCLAHTKWGTDQVNLLKIHKMIINKHLKIRRRGLRLSIQSSVKKARTNPLPRNKIGTENALCEAGVSTRAEMRNLNTTITAIRFTSNPNHPIRPNCLNPTKLDEYALRPAALKPLFGREMEYFGKLQIDTRKIERSPQYYFRPP